MRNTIFTILALTLSCLPLRAVAQDGKMKGTLLQVSENIKGWDTEVNLDTIDQENLPKRVTGGLLVSANMSNFILFRNAHALKSYMRVGADLAGFMDFTVTKHFAIQARLGLTAEQNQFSDTQGYMHLWSMGLDLPVLFLGRFGNMHSGYLSFGAGPYTHFTFASNVGDKYTNVEPASTEPDILKTYALHDNHSGLMATIGYEFPIGIAFYANYMVSLTDIYTFYKNEKLEDGTSLYPQRVSLGIAYHWK